MINPNCCQLLPEILKTSVAAFMPEISGEISPCPFPPSLLRPQFTHSALLKCSVTSNSVTPWTITHQAPLSLGSLQARTLEWVAMPSSRGSSQPRDRTQVSHLAGRFFTHWANQGGSRIPEWVSYPFSRGSSRPRNQTGVFCTAGGFFTSWATRETLTHRVIAVGLWA